MLNSTSLVFHLEYENKELPRSCADVLYVTVVQEELTTNYSKTV